MSFASLREISIDLDERVRRLHVAPQIATPVRRDRHRALLCAEAVMTQPTLLARLYKYIVEARCIRITDLKVRFPEEFTHECEEGHTGADFGRFSQRLSDALQFLLDEEVVLVNRRGRLVHVSAWKEKSQIRIERALIASQSVGAN
jgi:hypothetical protein